MTPFYTRFPEIAAAETRVAFVPASGGPLPRGEYGFIELSQRADNIKKVFKITLN